MSQYSEDHHYSWLSTPVVSRVISPYHFDDCWEELMRVGENQQRELSFESMDCEELSVVVPVEVELSDDEMVIPAQDSASDSFEAGFSRDITDDEEDLPEMEEKIMKAIAKLAPDAASARSFRFEDNADFRQYFESRKDEMRCFLTIYTTETSVEGYEKRVESFFPQHLKKTKDKEVTKYFFEIFDHESFHVVEGIIKPLPNLRKIEDLMGDELRKREELQNRLEEAMERTTKAKTRKNAAAKAVKRLVQIQKPPILRALDNVYTYVRSTVTIECSADGGDTNAELTLNSVNKVIMMMIEFGLTDKDIVGDMGCAYNVFAAHVAQMVGCRTMGIEYVKTCNFLGCGNFMRALHDKEHKGHLVNTKVAYVICDIAMMCSLCPLTFVYCFDEAFPLPLIEHIAKLAEHSKTVRFILSFKGSKFPRAHGIWKRHGFKLVAQVKVLKFQSNESNTCYLYKRISRHYPRPLKVKPYMLTEEMLRTQWLDPAWSSSKANVIKHYEQLTQQAALRLGTGSRKAKRELFQFMESHIPQCMSSAWQHCEAANDCSGCNERFKHLPAGDVTVKEISEKRRVLFAASHIGNDKLIRECLGEVFDKNPGLPFTAMICSGFYVIAPYISHSCEPNCVFIRWTDGEGQDRLSICSTCDIPKGTELTINFGMDYNVANPLCLCPVCTP